MYFYMQSFISWKKFDDFENWIKIDNLRLQISWMNEFLLFFQPLWRKEWVMAGSTCWSGVMGSSPLRPPTTSLGSSPSTTPCLLGTMFWPCGTVTSTCTSLGGLQESWEKRSTLGSVMELCKLIQKLFPFTLSLFLSLMQSFIFSFCWYLLYIKLLFFNF